MRFAFWRIAIGILALGGWAGTAAAQQVQLCGRAAAPLGADGRLLNHLPYGVALRAELVKARGVPGKCQAVNPAMLSDLKALMARAHGDPEVGQAIVAMSCFRTTGYQAGLFCRHRGNLEAKAWEIAPPGYSEHSTGLAIDFGDRRGGACNLEVCFANTRVGRWLLKNAPEFGFELSFPPNNTQGVSYEPWHWRWVGRDGESSLKAKATFAIARERYPTKVTPEPFKPNVLLVEAHEASPVTTVR